MRTTFQLDPIKESVDMVEIMAETYNNDIFEPLTKLASWPLRSAGKDAIKRESL
jgi:tetrahydromethanopterin S-methyltransferase subunit B